MRRVWQALTSARATVAVMLTLGALLLLNVVVPQEAVLGKQAVAQLAEQSAAWRFLLHTLGLGRLSTSPLFLAALAAFFLNLALVLLDRAHGTWKRLRFLPPSEAQVRALAGAPSAISFPRPPGFSGERAHAVLQRLGYRTSSPGPSSVWALRHRTAVVGFPLFHLSFFVLFAGGVALYLTRFVTNVAAAEGQQFETTAGKVLRTPPFGAPGPQTLVVEEVHPRLEGGRPTQLGATLRREGLGEEAAQTAWINHPAEWGPLSVLVEDAGLAPVLWLQDERGYTVDRVVVLAISSANAPVKAQLGKEGLWAQVRPVSVGPEFPLREALARFPVDLELHQFDKLVWKGQLRAGEHARAGAWTLKLDELRYWVKLRLVHEHGGLLLVVGFLMAVVGLVWRMWWFRREVGVVWDDARVSLVAKVEYFPRAFRDELETLRGDLSAADVVGQEPPPPGNEPS